MLDVAGNSRRTFPLSYHNAKAASIRLDSLTYRNLRSVTEPGMNQKWISYMTFSTSPRTDSIEWNLLAVRAQSPWKWYFILHFTLRTWHHGPCLCLCNFCRSSDLGPSHRFELNTLDLKYLVKAKSRRIRNRINNSHSVYHNMISWHTFQFSIPCYTSERSSQTPCEHLFSCHLTINF